MSVCSKQGFTLIELIVVLTVVSVLASVIGAFASRSLAMAYRLQCASNLRQLGFATQLYLRDNDGYPPAWQNSSSRWMDLVKPYLSGGTKSSAFLCPCDQTRTKVRWDSDITMSYGMNAFNFGGASHCFWYVVTTENVRQPSQTILLADCLPGLYYCGGGGSFSEPVKYVEYRHVGGTFCAVYCDGHAEVKKNTTKREWDASQ